MNNHITAISLIVLAAPLCTNAAKSLENLLPADTSIIVGVKNFDRLDKECNDGPLGDIINNRKIRDVLAPIIDQYNKAVENSKDQMIISWDDVRKYLGGQIVLGVNLDKILDETSEKSNTESLPGIHLLANVKDGDALTRLIANAMKEASEEKDPVVTEKDTEKFMGEEIRHFFVHDTENKPDNVNNNDNDQGADTEETHEQTAETEDTENSGADKTDQPKGGDIFFGNVKDTFFATISLEDARAAIEAIKGDEKGTLAESARAPEIHSLSENYDTYIYIYAKPYANFIEKLIRNTMKEKDNGQAGTSSGMIINALGLDSCKSLTIGAKFESDYVKFSTDARYDSSYGVCRLLRAVGDNYPTPDFVKDSTLRSVTASGFNASTFATELKAIAFAAYPPAAMIYQMQIAQFEQKSGVNIDTDIFGGFEEGLVAFDVDNPDKTPDNQIEIVPVYALKLKDPATFQSKLSSLTSMMTSPLSAQTGDYGSYKVITISSTFFKTYLSVKDGWLIVSPSNAALQGTLSTGKDDKSFWQGLRYRNIVLDRLPSGGSALSYSDIDVYIRTALYGLASVYNKTVDEKSDPDDKPIDTSLIPAVKDLPLAVCGKGFKTADGMHSESYLVKK